MFLIPDGRCEEHPVPGGGRHQLRVRGRHPLVDEVHVQDRRHPVRMWWVVSTLWLSQVELQTEVRKEFTIMF